MAYGATGIPKQMLHGSLTDFDKDVMHYVDALRKQYIVSFGPKTAELFEIYHQHLKNKYHWEHQAYEEWRNFQEYCMITGIQSIWLDCLSLKARIEEIEDHNKQCQPSDKISTLILEERLKELDTILKDLKNMWDKNKIDERKPNERYFWTPKKEMLLLVAKDKYKECPRDDENYGINDFVMSPDPTDHGAYSEYYGSQADVQVYRMHVSIPFWKPFTMYDAKNNIRPLNNDEYKDILNAYNGKKSLYNIFFDESEGNMPAEFDTNASRKVFIVDGDAEYEKMTFKADRIYCRAVDAEECKFNPSNYIICYYHFSSSEPIDEGRYISVGVKKHGVCEHYSGYVNE